MERVHPREMGGLMAYAYFQNQAAWDAYHNAACAANAIPHPGYRASDNSTVMIDAQWTDAHVAPIQMKGTGNVTTWAARVPDADVATYGLNAIPDSAVVYGKDANGMPNGTVTVTVGGKTYVSEPLTINFRKQKPPTWTDPKTGTVYQTGA